MKFIGDWRALALTTVVLWGVQGAVAKIALSRIPWRAACMCNMGGFFLAALLAYLAKPGPAFGPGYTIAILGGLCGGIGSLAFFKALEEIDISKLIPITAQYVVVATILGAVLFREPMTLPKIAGVALGVVSVVLLSIG